MKKIILSTLVILALVYPSIPKANSAIHKKTVKKSDKATPRKVTRKTKNILHKKVSTVTRPATVPTPNATVAKVKGASAPRANDTVAPAPVYSAQDCSTISEFSAKFLCLLNNYRTSNGVGTVSYNTAMSQVAYHYSTWMSDNHTFSHTGPNGETFTERCAAAGIPCHGENLAQGYTIAQTLFDAWKASPGHRANMLRSDFTMIGLGMVNGYTTNLFE